MVIVSPSHLCRVAAGEVLRRASALQYHQQGIHEDVRSLPRQVKVLIPVLDSHL